jgi:hypothetical protein
MATEARTLVKAQRYRVLTIPRFAGMTLGDAAVLGMQRLEDEGCRRVMFDRSSVTDEDWYGPADGGDWHLGYTFVPPVMLPEPPA